MPSFTLKKIEAIRGKQTFEELVVNNQGVLDIFRRQLKGTTYETELNTIVAYMDFIANLRTLPDSKFKVLQTDAKDSIKEYEFRSKHLRVYCIHKTGGKIVVLGGEKKNQKADLKTFRETKKQLKHLL